MAVYQANDLWVTNILQKGNELQQVNELLTPAQTYPIVQPQSPFEE